MVWYVSVEGTMNITTVNLSDGQLKELRKLVVENVSELMRQLVHSHIKKLRGGKKEYLRKKDKALELMAKARIDWYEAELVRAEREKDVETVKHHKKVLRGLRE